MRPHGLSGVVCHARGLVERIKNTAPRSSGHFECIIFQRIFCVLTVVSCVQLVRRRCCPSSAFHLVRKPFYANFGVDWGGRNRVLSVKRTHVNGLRIRYGRTLCTYVHFNVFNRRRPNTWTWIIISLQGLPRAFCAPKWHQYGNGGTAGCRPKQTA